MFNMAFGEKDGSDIELQGGREEEGDKTKEIMIEIN